MTCNLSECNNWHHKKKKIIITAFYQERQLYISILICEMIKLFLHLIIQVENIKKQNCIIYALIERDTNGVTMLNTQSVGPAMAETNTCACEQNILHVL